jgi:hypothetical protein
MVAGTREALRHEAGHPYVLLALLLRDPAACQRLAQLQHQQQPGPPLLPLLLLLLQGLLHFWQLGQTYPEIGHHLLLLLLPLLLLLL